MTTSYLGYWLLTRWIADDGADTTLDCTGQAHLTPLGASGTDIAYDESVAFRLAGKVIRGTRRYAISSPSEWTIVATFSDGSPFVSVHLGNDRTGTGIYVCGPDTYTLHLNIREAATWETVWEVTGSKRLHIVTRYRRLSVGTRSA